MWCTYPDRVWARNFGNKAKNDTAVNNGDRVVYVCFVNAVLMGCLQIAARKVMVKKSRYRPDVTQGVPGS